MRMKALITGADGFIGSHLTEILFERRYELRALAQYNSYNQWGWLERVECRNEIEIIAGDIRDSYFCEELTKDIDVVFHLAALIAIPYSYIAPASYLETNVNGTHNICQGAIKNQVSRMIHVSTSEVYGSAKYVPIDEAHPIQAQSPYSASKIGAEAIALSCYHAFDLGVTVARPFNTYGPRQSARAVIPTIITQLAAGNEIVKLGDVRPTRDFNYVDDTCRGLIALAETAQSIGKTVNIGSSTEHSIGDLFDMIRLIMDKDAVIGMDVDRVRPEKSEVDRLCCDASLYNQLTGLVPEVNIREGLERTVAWMSNPKNLAAYKSEIFNV